MTYLKKYLLFIFCLLSAELLAQPYRIVSLDGTISEILCELGLESQIVGVDVTSTYPESLKKLPKVGHNRNISAEGVLSLNPTLVLGLETGMVKPEVIAQLKAAGKNVLIFKREYTIESTKNLVREIAKYFNLENKAEVVIKKIEADLAKVKKVSPAKKVLFIYARGTGSMMVGGEGTSVEKALLLAGCENAIKGFTDFKPLTAEALILANPDVILLFSSGLESVGGVEGLLKVQGIAQTKAGKNRKIIEMDGQLLTGFGVRVGQAIVELADKVNRKEN
jgi:iron complex transport system substrate-binding protein